MPCALSALSKVLGYAIIAGSTFLKLPQVIKIVSAKSVAGLSPVSFYLEVIVYAATIVYNVALGYPFSTYGEVCIILVQNVFLVFLVWYYSTPRVSFVHMCSVSLVIIGSVFVMISLPEDQRAILPIFATGASICARVPQIMKNFSQGHTGQLAAATLVLNFAGILARIFTASQDTGDSVVIMCHSLSSLVTGTLLFQVFTYPKAEALEKKKN